MALTRLPVHLTVPLADGRLALALVVMTLLISDGCGGPRISQADREKAIEEHRAMIERFKNDSNMSPEIKRDMIERTQLEIDELNKQQ